VASSHPLTYWSPINSFWSWCKSKPA